MAVTTRAVRSYAREELLAVRIASEVALPPGEREFVGLRVDSPVVSFIVSPVNLNQLDLDGLASTTSGPPADFLSGNLLGPREITISSPMRGENSVPVPPVRGSTEPFIDAIPTDQEQVVSVPKDSENLGTLSSQMEYTSFFYDTPSECSALFGTLVRICFVGWWLSRNG